MAFRGRDMNEKNFSRRDFLTSLAAVGVGAMLPAGALTAQTGNPLVRPSKGRIDVHHHMYPPFYVSEMNSRSNWMPMTSIEAMDKADIATAMLSPVALMVQNSMADRSERARMLVRKNNEYGAQMVKDFPGRF